MLAPIVLVALPEVVTLIHTYLKAEENFLDGDGHGARDLASLGCPFEVASVLYLPCMVLK
jgi:hypothetical protein